MIYARVTNNISPILLPYSCNYSIDRCVKYWYKTKEATSNIFVWCVPPTWLMDTRKTNANIPKGINKVQLGFNLHVLKNFIWMNMHKHTSKFTYIMFKNICVQGMTVNCIRLWSFNSCGVWSNIFITVTNKALCPRVVVFVWGPSINQMDLSEKYSYWIGIYKIILAYTKMNYL